MEDSTIRNVSFQEIQRDFASLLQQTDFNREISLSTLFRRQSMLTTWRSQCTMLNQSQTSTSLENEIDEMLELVSIRIQAEHMINTIDKFFLTHKFDGSYAPPLSITLATLFNWQAQLVSLSDECKSIEDRGAFYKKFVAKTRTVSDGFKFVSDRIQKLQNGKFFLSIDDVWGKRAVRYTGIQYSLNRTGIFPAHLEGYNLTKTNAETSEFIAADDASTHSTSSSARMNETFQVDIFGSTSDLGRSQIAHLMPAADLAALTWYPVVPWVLPGMDADQIQALLPADRWELVRRCILGTRPIGKSDSKPQGKSKTHSTALKTNKKKSSPKKKSPPTAHRYNTRQSNNNSTILQTVKSDSSKTRNKKNAATVRTDTSGNRSHQSKSTKKRIQGTGIKHFFTNLIRLKSQFDYFDRDPCLLIVPILSLEEVRNWKGEGYSAIVLAGKWPINETTSTTAAEVYSGIGAHLGGDDSNFLASRADLEKATNLLTIMLQMVANQCMPESKNLFKHYQADAYEDFKTRLTNANPVEPSAANSALKGSSHPVVRPDEIAVPRLVDDINEGYIKVRKIVFRSISQVNEGTSTIASVSSKVDSTIPKWKVSDAGVPDEIDSSLNEHEQGIMEMCQSDSLPVHDKCNQTSGRSSDDGIDEDRKPSPTTFVEPDYPQQVNSNDVSEKADTVRPIAPEPLLVTVKSISNWLRRNSGFLVVGAGAKVYETDNGSADYMDELRAWNWPTSPRDCFSHEPPLSEIVIKNRTART